MTSDKHLLINPVAGFVIQKLYSPHFPPSPPSPPTSWAGPLVPLVSPGRPPGPQDLWTLAYRGMANRLPGLFHKPDLHHRPAVSVARSGLALPVPPSLTAGQSTSLQLCRQFSQALPRRPLASCPGLPKQPDQGEAAPQPPAPGCAGPGVRESQTNRKQAQAAGISRWRHPWHPLGSAPLLSSFLLPFPPFVTALARTVTILCSVI